MLKRIRADQVELGMFIHRLEGNWFRHPFWKAHFVLDDPVRLDSLRASGVRAVLIDVTRGRDVAEPEVVDPSNLAPLRAPVGGAQGGAAPPGRRTATLSPEIARAERLARATGKAVNRMFIEAQLGKHVAASDVEPVIEDIYASIQRNIYAFNGLLQCQSDQVHLYRQALAVSALMVALGRRMGLPPAKIREAGMAGLMMDMGLAQMATEAGAADYRDLCVTHAKGHVVDGVIRLRAAGDIPDGVLLACQQHHERLDGSGYPQGLSGADIGMPARMAAVCDDYVRLVTGVDAPALDPANALAHIRAQVGIYDDAVTARLIETVGVYPIGSFVHLRSGRLAMVVDQDDADFALPIVRIFAATEPRVGGVIPTRPTTLALGQCYGEDAIAGLVDPAGLRLPPLESLRGDLLAGAIRSSAR
ncbi:HD-GYP domain-containing protein [Novosphingobium sp. Fuku2-ISO-50]|uniref:HD-GYP domain-containing protein n=1 Tax=Novosphingobium sp. Fuku2-ISO-50 TaxID=1739114 RepID=UPI00076CB851|nr:DUF3391 domain-containing protein [Novosphingobium sp. Fuku2-ISO-50]KUR79892.1 metal-dependent phosphohydrolase [Novosphingobium sp. Fuku2-ISO-50]